MSPNYFKSTDGRPVYTDADELHQFRGLFSNTSDWLSSPMKADIFTLSSTPSPSPPCVGGLRPWDLLLALKIIYEAVEQCSKYPGDQPVVGRISPEPFSFMFDDFSLSNIMALSNHAIHRYFNSIRSHQDSVGWWEVAQ